MSDHPSWEQWADYVEVRLPDSDHARLASHLATCSTCEHDFEWLRATLTLLDEQRFAAPPDEVRARVLEQFGKRNGAVAPPRAPLPSARPLPTRRPWLRVIPAVATIAALAALILLAPLLWQREPEVFITAMVDATNGTVLLQREGEDLLPVDARRPLTEGDIVSTGEHSQATLVFANDGLQVEVYPDSALLVEHLPLDGEEGKQFVVRCKRGKMLATVQRPTPLLMNAYGNQLSTTDATFEVAYLQDHATRVRVEKGTVQVQNEAGFATLGAGEQVLLWYQTAPGEPLPYPLRYPTPDPNAQGSLHGTPRLPDRMLARSPTDGSPIQ